MHLTREQHQRVEELAEEITASRKLPDYIGRTLLAGARQFEPPPSGWGAMVAEDAWQPEATWCEAAGLAGPEDLSSADLRP